MNTRHGAHVILGAITPSYQHVDADELIYPHLRQALGLHNLPGVLFSENVLLRRKPFEATVLKEDINIAYFLTAAYRLQKAWTPPAKLFWSKQVTMTSVRLFGRPLSGEVAKVAHDELRYMERIAAEFPARADFFKPVMAAYGSLVTQRSEVHPSLEIRYWQLLRDVRKVFYERYGTILACFDGIAAGTLLKPAELHELFKRALQLLQSRDTCWSEWKVIQDGSAKLCVNPIKRSIIIGKRRAPVPIEDARGLFAHEVLVHAGRSLEGRKRTTDLAIGLPGYTVAEEGFGVLVESAVNGRFSPKVKDRYIDIALALGSGTRRALSRSELFTFCYSRAVIRAIANQDDISLETLEKVTWEHVNRIYRGSLGNHYVGVFTRDIAYYKGFMRMAKYLERKRGVQGIEKTIDYLMQGKFDPTDKSHRQRVKEASQSTRSHDR